MNVEQRSVQVIVCGDAKGASRKVAEIFANAIRANPQLVLGLATGGTPVGVYRQLVRMHRDEGLDFSGVTTFNLDEYVGLGPEHPQGFRHFMNEQLFDHVNIAPVRTHLLDGLAADIHAECRDYETRIRDAGGIDLQLLGIGINGHIAFNEPGSPADSPTRLVELTENTIQANSRFFDSIDEVPSQAVTMGIGTILETKRIVLMATGENKASTVAQAIHGQADPRHPASLLQNHPSVTFVLDKAAASGLETVS